MVGNEIALSSFIKFFKANFPLFYFFAVVHKYLKISTGLAKRLFTVFFSYCVTFLSQKYAYFREKLFTSIFFPFSDIICRKNILNSSCWKAVKNFISVDEALTG
jgi:hypothetical protein